MNMFQKLVKKVKKIDPKKATRVAVIGLLSIGGVILADRLVKEAANWEGPDYYFDSLAPEE